MNRQQGRTELPPEQSDALRRAVRLEWITIGFLTVTVTAVFLVMGNSQAMRAAWIEDMLSFIPPLAFLLAVRLVARPPSSRYPYGYHRSIGVAHLVAAVALTTMGSFLIYESITGLLKGEHPPIGTVEILGNRVWLGWLMMAVMAVTTIPPVIAGRIKIRLARQLHNKVLYADADMNKADWMTAVGSIIGVAGIGLGFWWADAAAALFIAVSILRDGLRNMRGAITDLVDTTATTFDDSDPDPLAAQVKDYLHSLPWVEAAGVRMRDEGQVFHVEAFVVPVNAAGLSLPRLAAAREGCAGLDWKLADTVVIPVQALPDELGGHRGVHQSGGEE
ncbi:cation diffusion facilitator family transporter [Arthrobacter sp. APC 3897]|uniref:cation diffusion facilitator family transporter n=1 Tax=Arthrobacter sp. APC 3897 TaxID=3035204 RepID=UPI0025B5CB75|nr:cation diffusion facilitator family transporter [Arthrobacter sp. APC 3897]MDN3481790.1 cation diffusion facilitator family transporter [Arthrobacter sp. APC 3897]